MQVSQPITATLQDMARGDKTALDRLMPYVYAELKKLAFGIGYKVAVRRVGYKLGI